MEAQEQPANRNQENQSEKKTKMKKPKKEKFNWWQTLLLLLTTLVVSVGAAYFVSTKYLWPKYDQGQLQQRLTSAQKEVDSKPNDPKSHVDLGYAYFLKGDYNNAIKQYLMAKDLDKNDFDAYLNLGLAYNQVNQLNDAATAAQKATELSPKDYKGYLLKGMVYRKLKMYKDAIKALNEANKLSPANTDILYEIGKVAEDQGDKKNAADIYKTTLSYDPMYKPAIDGLKRVSKN